MSKTIHYGYKEALLKGLVKEGAVVVSYPDRKGESQRGIITKLDFIAPLDDYTMAVQYAESSPIEIEYYTGRYSFDLDTNLDIMLIEIENE